MFRVTLRIVLELSDKISNKLKIKFNMSEKSKKQRSHISVTPKEKNEICN